MHLTSAGSGTAPSRAIAAPVSEVFAADLAVDVASVAVALRAAAKLVDLDFAVLLAAGGDGRGRGC